MLPRSYLPCIVYCVYYKMLPVLREGKLFIFTYIWWYTFSPSSYALNTLINTQPIRPFIPIYSPQNNTYHSLTLTTTFTSNTSLATLATSKTHCTPACHSPRLSHLNIRVWENIYNILLYNLANYQMEDSSYISYDVATLWPGLVLHQVVLIYPLLLNSSLHYTSNQIQIIVLCSPHAEISRTHRQLISTREQWLSVFICGNHCNTHHLILTS